MSDPQVVIREALAAGAPAAFTCSFQAEDMRSEEHTSELQSH